MNHDKASKILAEIFAPPPAGEAGPHPDADQLIAWAEAEDGGAEFDRVDAHLDRCPECAALAARLADAHSRRDEPLPFPIYTPDLAAVRVRRERNAARAQQEPQRLAAAEKDLPEIVVIDGLLPGFSGEATGDGCAPSVASTLRLALSAAESPRPAAIPAQGAIAVYPTGQTAPALFAWRNGRWRAELPLPLPWPEVVELLEKSAIRIEPVA